jgi:hypothetical protein
MRFGFAIGIGSGWAFARYTRGVHTAVAPR